VGRTIELLQRLSESDGISGFEAGIGKVVEEEMRSAGAVVEVDRVGNRIALLPGSEDGGRLLLTAHADEIGLIVRKVDRGGVLRFAAVGGIDPRVLPGQEVMVHGEKRLPGVIGSEPPHLQLEEEKDRVVEIEDLFIDVGLTERTVRRRVKTGDPIALSRKFMEMEGGLCAAKAFDDRASLAALVLAVEELARRDHRWDIYAVATVQEEIAHLGATVSAYGLDPGLAVVLDVTYGDMLGVDKYETYELGGGPTLGVGPGYHPRLRARLMETAEREGIPIQDEAEPRPRGTDAAAIQLTREGVPTALVGIPVRYMHTFAEVVATADVEGAARLLVEFSAELVDVGFLLNPDSITQDRA